MSAYIVDREHIRFLVNAALSRAIVGPWGRFRWVWDVDRETGTYRHGELPPGDYERAAEVGQMLWDENIASVRHRYPDCGPWVLPGQIEDTPLLYGEHRLEAFRTFDPVAVIKACDGYEYQSCEHPGWETSEAKAFVDSLRRSAWHRLPGYEDAAWEVTA